MLKRPFVCVAIAFAAGILSFAYGINIFLLLATSLVLTGVVYFCGEKHRFLFFTMIIVFLLGISGMKLADWRRGEILRRFENREMEITATVTEFSSDGKAIANFKDNGKTYKIYLIAENKPQLYPGDIVKATVTPQEPYSSKVSVSDFATHLASKKVYMTGYASEVTVTGREKYGIMGAVYSIRRYVDKIGEKAFYGDNRALFNAMVLGDKHLMSPRLQASLRSAGLNHIAVVSGMHLSIMISVLMLLLGSILGVGRRAKVLLCIGAVAVTLLTGAGMSAVRAAVMCIVCQGAFLTRRENDPLSGLSVTVFVMLAINPFAVFDIGFVLSVLSVLGILLFLKPMEEKVLPRIGGIVGKTICVSVSAQLTVVPAVICFFGTVSPYSVPANVMVTVFASLVVTMGMIFVAVAKIPVISGITAYVVKLCSEAVTSVCKFVEDLPGALADAQGIGWDFFILWVFLLVLLGMKKKHRKYTLHISVCFAVVLMTAFLIQNQNIDKTKMHSVSYGKNAMTALQYPDGPFVLLGCPDGNEAVLLAESYGRRSYTYTVITNKDACDAEYVANAGVSGTVIACSEMFSAQEKQEFKEELKAYETDVIFLENGKTFADGDFSVRFHVFYVSEKFIAAAELEHKGESFVSLQDFDSFGLEALKRENCFFQCDWLLLPENLPESGETFENLTTGRVLADCQKFILKKQ